MSKRPSDGPNGDHAFKRHRTAHSHTLSSTIVPSPLPSLPPVLSAELKDAPFRHASTSHHARSITASAPKTYDQLEFLGDAYLEIFATRLIFEGYAHLPAGQMSQLREALVKNETLAQYSMAYGFDQRVYISEIERRRMVSDAKDRGNKGFNKVMGDVWEAFIATVVLDERRPDGDSGEAIAEKFMRRLWLPKLTETVRTNGFALPRGQRDEENGGEENDPLTVYNEGAKAELQKRMAGKDTKIEYVPYKPPVELKGAQLGQSRHYIALYFTGYGYQREFLGQAEGKNKVEAGNWAAIHAMHGEKRHIMQDVWDKNEAARAQRRAQLEQEKRNETI